MAFPLADTRVRLLRVQQRTCRPNRQCSGHDGLHPANTRHRPYRDAFRMAAIQINATKLQVANITRFHLVPVIGLCPQARATITSFGPEAANSARVLVSRRRETFPIV
jgi:hypothetical protein